MCIYMITGTFIERLMPTWSWFNAYFHISTMFIFFIFIFFPCHVQCMCYWTCTCRTGFKYHFHLLSVMFNHVHSVFRIISVLEYVLWEDIQKPIMTFSQSSKFIFILYVNFHSQQRWSDLKLYLSVVPTLAILMFIYTKYQQNTNSLDQYQCLDFGPLMQSDPHQAALHKCYYKFPVVIWCMYFISNSCDLIFRI